jgi:hypothetical protein
LLYQNRCGATPQPCRIRTLHGRAGGHQYSQWKGPALTTSTLHEMGIRNPSEISRYVLRHADDRTDELTIHYRRQHGSLLPVTRTYEFRRMPRTIVTDSGSAGTEAIFEASPKLLEALEELDALLGASADPTSRKIALVDQLNALKAQATAGADKAAIAAAFERLEQQIREL